MKKVCSFEDLTCWQKARKLRKLLYQLAKQLPDYEKYKLASQIRSAAFSITSNLAEGYGRYSYTEKIHFARISRASALESKDHLYTCLDANYIEKKEFDYLYNQCGEVSKSINGYIGYIWNQKQIGNLKT